MANQAAAVQPVELDCADDDIGLQMTRWLSHLRAERRLSPKTSEAYARDLRRAGIVASVRAVDAVQFEQRRLGFDFDMIEIRWDQSLSPGNEQWFYWGSEAADHPGTRNYMGAKDPAIDAMIAAMLEARERPAFVSAVRALDRALMSGFYAIPLFNVQQQWIARWNRIERPAVTALTGYLPETWWQRPDQPK